MSYAQLPEHSNILWGNKNRINFINKKIYYNNNASINQNEGVSCISDASGNLMLYTDGQNVYDFNQNEIDGSLRGHVSSAQSALIVPAPLSTCKYYIFTTDYGNYGDTPKDNLGVNYNLYDLSKTDKSVFKNKQVFKPSIEKITAIPHANMIDYWIITHSFPGNTFKVYLLDSSGLSDTPIISNIGFDYIANNSNVPHKGWEVIGMFIPSPDHKKLLVTHLHNLHNNKPFCELFDFDNETGIISNLINIEHPITYSAIFTPDSKKIIGDNIYLDISSGNEAVINSSSSKKLISNNGAMVKFIGQDSLIYLQGLDANSSMYVINDIDATQISASKTGIQTNTLYKNQSFPNFIYHYSNNLSNVIDIEFIGELTVCENDEISIFAMLNHSFDDVKVKWTFNGKTVSTDSHLLIENAQKENEGTYYFEVGANCGVNTKVDSVKITVNDPNAKLDSKKYSICDNSSATISLISDSTLTNIKWSNNSTDNTIEVDESGTYTVSFEYKSCKRTLTAVVEQSENPKFEIFGDNQICRGEVARLESSIISNNYLWSTGENTKSILVTESGIYTLEIENEFGCSSIEEFTVKVSPDPKVKIDGQLEFCKGYSSILESSNTYYKYEWSTGDDSKSIEVNKEGQYILKVYSELGCVDYDTVFVKTYDSPTINIIGETSFCNGENAVLSLGKKYEKVNWSNGKTSHTITVDKPMTLVVEVEDEFGCSGSATVTTEVYDLPNFDIIGQNNYCIGESVTLYPNKDFNNYLWSNQENSKSITIDKAGTYSLTVYNENNCSITKDIEINFHNLPQPIITGQKYLCEGEHTELELNDNFNSIEWFFNNEPNPLGSNKELTAFNSGTYIAIVQNEYGCENSSIFVINPLKPEQILDKSIIDFLTLDVGQTENEEIIIGNIGTSTPKINRPNKLNEFQLIINNNKIEVEFSSDNIGVFSEDLTISFDKPCYIEFPITLSAEVRSSNEFTVYAPVSQIMKPGHNNKSLEFTYKINTDKPLPQNIEYQIELQIEESVLGITNHNSNSLTFSDNKYIFNGNKLIDSKTGNLFTVWTDVYLNKANLYTLKLSNLEVLNDFYKTNTVDGDINLLGICRQDDKVITLFLPTEVITTINNDNINLEIYSNYQGNFDFSLTDTKGAEIYTNSINITNQNTTFELSTHSIPNGIYYLRINAPDKSILKKILIIK